MLRWRFASGLCRAQVCIGVDVNSENAKPPVMTGVCKSHSEWKGGLMVLLMLLDAARLPACQETSDQAQVRNRTIAESEGGWWFAPTGPQGIDSNTGWGGRMS